MMRELLKSKIHRATVTGADVSYVGSITIDAALVRRANLWPGEKVLVVDNTNGERLETYVILAPPRSGAIVMNGGAARRIRKGHNVTIMAFTWSSKPVKAKMILVDHQNRFLRSL